MFVALTKAVTDCAGQAILHALAKKSDVFVENFIPGKLKSMLSVA